MIELPKEAQHDSVLASLVEQINAQFASLSEMLSKDISVVAQRQSGFEMLPRTVQATLRNSWGNKIGLFRSSKQ